MSRKEEEAVRAEVANKPKASDAIDTSKKGKPQRKILIITGSRGEYGYIRPVIDLIEKDDDLDYELIVTNMHLLQEFGYSLQEIEKEGYKIGAMIHNTYDGYNDVTMVKSLASFLHSLPETIRNLKGDIILLAGDRGEQLMAAIAGAHMNIPVAHIQAGERSGNIDGLSRHAIAKFAHIHFASNKDAADRLKKMGEQEFRIHITGAPQLDEFLKQRITPKDKLFKKYGFDTDKPLYLVVQHSLTEEYKNTAKQIEETMKAVIKLDGQIMIIYPNSDAGSKVIKDIILKYKTKNIKIYRNIPREDYAGFMNSAQVLIGNSSSGILEAPSFKLPAVNIGNRQKGRVQAKNVINVKEYDSEKIFQAIKKACSDEFRKSLKDCSNPYGDGRAAERIVKVLKEVPIDDNLLCKDVTY